MSTTIVKLKKKILHTSKIKNLLPVCLRNNRQLADHICEPYAKFYKKWYRIAYVIVLDRKQIDTAPL